MSVVVSGEASRSGHGTEPARKGSFQARALLVAAGLLFVCEASAAETRVTGSDLLGEGFASAVVRAANSNEWAVQVDLTGTRPALQQLRQGRVDVALLALPPGELPPGDEFFSREIAAQPIVVIVPEAVPLTQITHAQVRGIFATGAVENYSTWGELGLTGSWWTRAITTFALDTQAGLTLPLVRRLGLNGGDLKPTVTVVPSLSELSSRLMVAESGIALTSAIPEAGSGLRALALAASLTDPAYLPTADNLHRAAYPWRLPLYLTVRRTAVPRLLPFVHVLLGEHCHKALEAAHYVPLPTGARNQLLLELEQVR
jgi:ABC-type phosphate transport system substrate-binding protein